MRYDKLPHKGLKKSKVKATRVYSWRNTNLVPINIKSRCKP